MSTITQQQSILPAVRIRGRRSNFIPATTAVSTEIAVDERRSERITLIATIVLAATALASTTGFALALLL